ncbi:MAG: Gfo/Idh/MocA family oxidoreductase [Planctomycetes bacterium]|nr:Gfo/Idh/MocA family oxidoreductase [Planctomycetota bacterium]
MKKKLRWGILGVAKINERLLPAFAKAANAEVVGIASRSLQKAQDAAKAAGIPKALGSYEALLDDPSIDAIYNPLPNTLHDEWTRKAAERGKHVLCEKPLTPSARACESLVNFCRDKKIKLMDGFMWPHHPRTRAIREFLDSGKLGRVERVTGTFTFQLPMDPSNIRLQAKMAGGSLLDVGCYPVYGIRWAFGDEPVKVWAAGRFQFDVDVAMSATLWFADGRLATFDCGFVHPLRQWLEIVCEKGTLGVPEMWVPRKSNYMVTYNESTESSEVKVEGFDQIQCMIENFGRYVLEDKPVWPPPTEAIKTAKVMDALLTSAREKRCVKV